MEEHGDSVHDAIMADVLRNVARELGVSADYLLGLDDLHGLPRECNRPLAGH